MRCALLCSILSYLSRFSLTLALCCALLCPCAARAQDARAPQPPGPRLPGPRLDPVPPSSPSKALRWTGVGLGVLGTGALATGWAFSLRGDQLQDRLRLLEPSDPRLGPTRSSAERARNMSWIGVGGGALSIGALQLALPAHEGVPLWSYLVGAGGVAMMSVGAFELATSGRCEAPLPNGDCDARKESTERGALMLATALPLLTIPLTYAIRSLISNERAKIGVRPQISGTSWSLKVQGKF